MLMMFTEKNVHTHFFKDKLLIAISSWPFCNFSYSDASQSNDSFLKKGGRRKEGGNKRRLIIPKRPALERHNYLGWNSGAASARLICSHLSLYVRISI